MSERLLLDANLVVLLTVGLSGKRPINAHKRLAAFDDRDYRILVELIDQSAGMVTCPNVMTEASNLLRSGGGKRRLEDNAIYSKKLADLISTRIEEFYVSSVDGVRQNNYPTIGLTDAILVLLAKPGVLLLTADFGLYGAALSAKLQAQNFNHVRDARRIDFQ